MKEHFQDFGVRKWAGDDLIELQAEPLAALQTLVAPYAPCILQGCEMETVSDGSGGTTYRLHAGLAALKGVDVAGNPCVKIVRVEETPWTSDTVYLSLKCEQKSRTYADGNNKVIANEYKAALSATQSDGALKISATDGAPRLVDKLGITQKLNTVGGNAKDVVVTFVESMEDARPELKSGSSLGLLLQQIRKWFDELKDLKALAFKAKVAKGDLDADLKEELDGKVETKDGYGLSKNDFSNEWMEKLNDIEPNANNYSLPLAASNMRGGVKTGYTQNGKNYPVQLSDEKMYVYVPWTDTDTVYTHPTSAGNKHIPTGGKSGMYLKWSASGTATWAKPSASEIEAAPASHTHTPSDIGAAPASHTHAPSDIGAASTAVASATSAGLMPAADKKKLDNIADVTITISGTQLKFTWTPPNTRYPCTATLSAGGPSVSGGTTA